MAVSFVAILIVACGMALLAKRLRLPYTVVLVVAGLIVSALSAAGQLGLNLKLTPELLLQLFLIRNNGLNNIITNYTLVNCP